MLSAPITRIVGRTLGRQMTQHQARAASPRAPRRRDHDSRARATTAPRRARCAPRRSSSTTPMTTKIVSRPGSNSAASAIASSSAGNASTTSVRRMSTPSTQPPTYPAAMPTVTPMRERQRRRHRARRGARCARRTSRRLSTSRPSSSVPSQNGRRRRKRIAEAVGDGSQRDRTAPATAPRARHGDSSATITKASRCETRWRALSAPRQHADARVDHRGTRQSTTMLAPTTSAALKSTVAHDHRDVLVEDRLDRQPAEPGPVEDRLGEHDAAHQPGEVEPEQRDQRDERVAQRVLAVDAHRRQPLGARRADVVLSQHVAHVGVQQPRVVRAPVRARGRSAGRTTLRGTEATERQAGGGG